MSTISTWAQLIEEDVKPMEHLQLVLALLWVVKFTYSQFTANALTLAQYSSSLRSYELHNRLMEAVMNGAANGYLVRREGVPLYVAKDFYVQSHQLDASTVEDEHLTVWPTFIRTDEAIWFIDSLQAYYALEQDLIDAANNYQRNGYFCIVYTGQEQRRLATVQRIFEHLFALYVTNVNVFLSGQRTPYVYTYFPYTSKQCHRAVPQLFLSFGTIGRQLDTFQLSHTFFPSKVDNMHGCELIVVPIEIAPFVNVDRDERTGTVRRLHGIEGLLLTLIADQMNFTFRVIPAPSNDRGVIYSNGSSTGAVHLIIEGQANLTFGIYIHEKRRATHMLATYSDVMTQLLIGVSRGRQLTPMERLTKPFRHLVWCVLGFMVLLAILAILLLRLVRRATLSHLIFGRRNRVPLTNLLNTLLGGNLPGTLPRGNFARYLLTLWVLQALVLRNAYQGELYIMIQDARALTGVASLQEAVDQNYSFYCTYEAANVLQQSMNGARIEYISTEESASVEMIQRLQAGEQQMAVPMLLQTLRMHNQRAHSIDQRIGVLNEQFLTISSTFYLRQHSFLLHKINWLLLHINTAGLVSKFESQYVARNVDNIQYTQEPTVLSIWLIGGIFCLYGPLILLSFVIFLLELRSTHSPWLAYILNLLNC